MALAQMHWQPVSLHQVVLAWLKAERASNAVLAQVLATNPDAARLLDTPDLQNADQNWWRLRLLYLARWVFLVELPPDTRWYEVRNLRDDDLPSLRAVNYHEWTDPADQNELVKVGARKHFQLTNPPSEWGSIVLWGHAKQGPFTIIEGNHRLTAYVGGGGVGLDIPVLVGLSPLKCHWHILDASPLLMQDLIPKGP